MGRRGRLESLQENRSSAADRADSAADRCLASLAQTGRAAPQTAVCRVCCTESIQRCRQGTQRHTQGARWHRPSSVVSSSTRKSVLVCSTTSPRDADPAAGNGEHLDAAHHVSTLRGLAGEATRGARPLSARRGRPRVQRGVHRCGCPPSGARRCRRAGPAPGGAREVTGPRHGNVD
jgi:hypothetical protein